jgi:hypothetical protein
MSMSFPDAGCRVSEKATPTPKFPTFIPSEKIPSLLTVQIEFHRSGPTWMVLSIRPTLHHATARAEKYSLQHVFDPWWIANDSFNQSHGAFPLPPPPPAPPRLLP